MPDMDFGYADPITQPVGGGETEPVEEPTDIDSGEPTKPGNEPDPQQINDDSIPDDNTDDDKSDGEGDDNNDVLEEGTVLEVKMAILLIKMVIFLRRKMRLLNGESHLMKKKM